MYDLNSTSFNLNSSNNYAPFFSTNSLQGGVYYPILNVPTSDILFFSSAEPGAAVAGMKKLPDTNDNNRFVAWFVDGTITQSSPWYTLNKDKIAPPFYDAFINTSSSLCDTDGDSVPNTLDLDSDGDGCSDALEASATTITTPNYTFSGPFGTNGLENTLESTTDSGVVNYIATYDNATSVDISNCTDTDGDGVADTVDVDDDVAVWL